MKKILKNFWKPFLFPWLVYIALTFVLTVINSKWWVILGMPAVGLLAFSVMPVILVKSLQTKKEKIITLLLIVFPLILFSGFFLWFGIDSFRFMHFYVIIPFVGFLVGVSLVAFRKVAKLKIVNMVLLIALYLWIVLDGHYKWTDYIFHKNVETNCNYPAVNFRLYSKKAVITRNDLNGKVVVFDFWTPGCSSCIESFEIYKRTKDKWINNKDVLFYTVFVSNSEDSIYKPDACQFLSDRGYEFENLYMNKFDSMSRVFGIKSIPVIMVLNKDGNIVYKGNAQGVNDKLKSLVNLN